MKHYHYLSMNTLSPEALYRVLFTKGSKWRTYHAWGKEPVKLKFTYPKKEEVGIK